MKRLYVARVGVRVKAWDFINMVQKICVKGSVYAIRIIEEIFVVNSISGGGNGYYA